MNPCPPPNLPIPTSQAQGKSKVGRCYLQLIFPHERKTLLENLTTLAESDCSDS